MPNPRLLRAATLMFALLLGAPPASADVWLWSQTPATNSNADLSDGINWAEGMAPSAVNDSARALMAEAAKWRDDISSSKPANALMTTAGSANVQTLTTNGSSSTLKNGWTVCFQVGAGLTNTGATTLNVDSLGAKAVQAVAGSAMTGGELAAATLRCATYRQPTDVWLLRDPVQVGTGVEYNTTTGAIQRSALTGDVTASAASNVTAIGSSKVTSAMIVDGTIVSADILDGTVANADLANMANATFKCRNTAGTGVPEDCTTTQVKTLLALVIGTNTEAWDADLDAFALKTAPTGAVVGTSDSQTLTNKSIVATQLTGTVPAAQMPALTGDVTTSAGAVATTIATGAVTTGKILDATVGTVDLDATVTKGLHPAGEVITMAGTTCPSGSLEADGSSQLRATYASLFTYMGAIYGAADGTHFTLPNYKGRFLRGWDHAAGLDPDAASRTDRGDGTTGDVVGSKQADAFKSHNHGYTPPRNDHNTAVGGGTHTSDEGSTNSGTTQNTGGNETRPVNINVLFCIYTGV